MEGDDNILVGDWLQYPDLVTISSSGGTYHLRPDVLGIYKKTNLSQQGRPVWRSTVREDRYLLYNGKQRTENSDTHWKWIVSSSQDQVGETEVYLRSVKAGLTYIPVRGWACSLSGEWYDDDLLTVRGEQTYPDLLTLASEGATSEYSPEVLGVYQRTNQTHSARPVWRNRERGDMFLFYNGKYSYFTMVNTAILQW